MHNVCQLAASEHGQSLVALCRVKKQQQSDMCFKLHLNELTDGEMRIFRDI